MDEYPSGDEYQTDWEDHEIIFDLLCWIIIGSLVVAGSIVLLYCI